MAGIYILVDKHPVLVADTAMWSGKIKVGMIAVKQTYTRNSFVSTVFLGMDDEYDGIGPIKLFETIIRGGEYDDYCDRYETWEEAKEGHKKVLKLIKLIENEIA